MCIKLGTVQKLLPDSEEYKPDAQASDRLEMAVISSLARRACKRNLLRSLWVWSFALLLSICANVGGKVVRAETLKIA